MPRPSRLVAVCGTSTEVGKTWVAATVLARAAGAGWAVAARKPVQSFDPHDADHTDAHLLGAATHEHPEHVCPAPRWYGAAMAPPMAAHALGLPPFTIDDLFHELYWPVRCDLGLVETVGGVRSPMAADGDCLSFLQRLEPDATLLVADAGLGTINAVRLSTDVLNGAPCVVYLNRFDHTVDLHQRNLLWLTEHYPLVVVTDPAVATELLLGHQLRPS